MPLRGALRYSQRSGHLQTRFAQTVQVPSSERCSVAQHGLMAGDTSRLVRFANLARMACSLRSPRGVLGLPHSSTLTSHHGHGTPCHYARLPHSSFLTPHSSLLIPHPSLLTPHSSLLIPHSSFLTPPSSLLTPPSSFLIPHSSPLTPHPSLLPPHSTPSFRE